MGKKENAKTILEALGMPARQQNDMCCHVLLALLGVTPRSKWIRASNNWLRIHDILTFLKEHYLISYAENSRETIRKEALHRFRTAALIEDNGQATNSPNYRYRITEEALLCCQAFGSRSWQEKLALFSASHVKLKEIYASRKRVAKIPIKVNGVEHLLSTGSHNLLQKAVLEEFATRFARQSSCLYVGDSEKRDLFKNEEILKKVHFEVSIHDKMPDVIFYNQALSWLYLVECVTSVGPMSPQRVIELKKMAEKSKAGLVFVTAFPDFRTFKRFAEGLAWETEVWIAEMPDHMIHMNGDKFMGPHTGLA